MRTGERTSDLDGDLDGDSVGYVGAVVWCDRGDDVLDGGAVSTYPVETV